MTANSPHTYYLFSLHTLVRSHLWIPCTKCNHMTTLCDAFCKQGTTDRDHLWPCSFRFPYPLSLSPHSAIHLYLALILSLNYFSIFIFWVIIAGFSFDNFLSRCLTLLTWRPDESSSELRSHYRPSWYHFHFKSWLQWCSLSLSTLRAPYSSTPSLFHMPWQIQFPPHYHIKPSYYIFIPFLYLSLLSSSPSIQDSANFSCHHSISLYLSFLFDSTVHIFSYITTSFLSTDSTILFLGYNHFRIFSNFVLYYLLTYTSFYIPQYCRFFLSQWSF